MPVGVPTEPNMLYYDQSTRKHYISTDQKWVGIPTTGIPGSGSTSGNASGIMIADAGNVVYVPTSELQKLATALGFETEALNRLMIRHLMPTMLSYQASANYARAALKEGLDVEIDFDPGMLDCVMHVGNLNVIMHFVRRSKLPMSVKRRFINRISDKLAEHAVQAMIDANKVEERRQQMQEQQAVVYERSKDKMARKTNTPEEPSPQRPTARKPKLGTEKNATPAGVRRSRR